VVERAGGKQRHQADAVDGYADRGPHGGSDGHDEDRASQGDHGGDRVGGAAEARNHGSPAHLTLLSRWSDPDRTGNQEVPFLVA